MSLGFDSYSQETPELANRKLTILRDMSKCAVRNTDLKSDALKFTHGVSPYFQNINIIVIKGIKIFFLLFPQDLFHDWACSCLMESCEMRGLNSHVMENSNLLRCDAALLGQGFPHFSKESGPLLFEE